MVGCLSVWFIGVGRCLKERLASERVGNGSLVGRWGKSSAEDSRSEREACYSLSFGQNNEKYGALENEIGPVIRVMCCPSLLTIPWPQQPAELHAQLLIWQR